MSAKEPKDFRVIGIAWWLMFILIGPVSLWFGGIAGMALALGCLVLGNVSGYFED